ncbi:MULTISPECIES: Rho-binding antiterminator [unclassified Agarivorans]|uniref:Rho-binding antiterminator n=1 Tax=unclassified Agarivorans TaxID=2636026 RepID=UPI0026E481A4|nr:MULTISPECIES: Rho-binding antiterminator [unclassified Agarivorans]MDO6684845.1 Rho-binding antiterminator [Agarivorans sp. 3_MG-2023]MDO6714994.1 Rho-binding antiterminator [Agarivorans sp. 2_MG-2023]
MISCQDYDYIEIVCMYHFPIRIELVIGETIQGKALDTQRNTEQEECIKVLVGEDERLINLSSIKRLTVLMDNPHFHAVEFN